MNFADRGSSDMQTVFREKAQNFYKQRVSLHETHQKKKT